MPSPAFPSPPLEILPEISTWFLFVMMRVPLSKLTVFVISNPPVLFCASPTPPLITTALVSVRAAVLSALYSVPPSIVSVPPLFMVPVYCQMFPCFSSILPLWVPGRKRKVPPPYLTSVPAPVMVSASMPPAFTLEKTRVLPLAISKPPRKYRFPDETDTVELL